MNQVSVNQQLLFLSGVTVGAGLMYLLDPGLGKRRRALLRDKASRFTNDFGDAVEVTARDFTNRARGIVAETQTLFHTEEVSDEVLVAELRELPKLHVSCPRSA